jgi:transposase
MDAPPPLPSELLASLPLAVVAYIAWQAEQIRVLTARVAELEAQLGKTPQNSSKPPSSTHPHDQPAPRPQGGGTRRRRGGQPGHPKCERALIPTAQCQAVVVCRPTACRRCGTLLAGDDADPLRQQVWELPEIRPHVTEYQRHRLVCSCGCSTCGPLPAGVPTGQAGPRLIAFAALLMACFRQSKRRAAQFLSMILNQPASPGWMVLLQNRAAEAVQPTYDELAERLKSQAVLYIDESPTKEGSAKAWIWTFVAASFTFFACRLSRSADVLQQLLGDAFAGVIHCDRARMYWRYGRLQWCWAHLQRNFQALIDHPCKTRQRLGHELMGPTLEMFALWQKVRDGTLSRRALRRRMQPIRQALEGSLLRGYHNERTQGFCKELYAYRECLWTFLDHDDVEPTNNEAERALRHAVIWRKLSFGTQSPSGSRFVERLLTIIETCRWQQRDAFQWLTANLAAHHHGRPHLSLLSGA